MGRWVGRSVGGVGGSVGGSVGRSVGSGGARDSMLPGHSQVNYLANQVQRKSRNTMPPCHGVLFN